VRLYVLRHAAAETRDAERWPDDAERPLSANGEKRFVRVARGLARAGISVEHVLSSPHRRAWATAALLETHAGWPAPTPCPPLAGVSIVGVAAALQATEPAATVALVGHEPLLSELASWLVAGTTVARLDWRTGGIARFAVEHWEAGGATLEWFVPPRLLRRLD
jgi:phosphohistidine phosphatase